MKWVSASYIKVGWVGTYAVISIASYCIARGNKTNEWESEENLVENGVRKIREIVDSAGYPQLAME